MIDTAILTYKNIIDKIYQLRMIDVWQTKDRNLYAELSKERTGQANYMKSKGFTIKAGSLIKPDGEEIEL